uniref:DEK-C domain-containing protein n=1 Tax=Brassica oleracea TaxID=3712 RepID=A0A3P6DK58_BRAOL|nr:unnamed protein product [Brassica oleracea]
MSDNVSVAHQLSKRKADDNLILLHTILYGKKAKAQMIKKNISQFSGFVWSEEEEEKQRGRVKEKLDKCIKEKLIFFCDVLDIPINRSHIKKKVAVKVLEFLESPKATRDVILADQEKEARERKITQKKKKSGESSDTTAKVLGKGKLKDQGDSDSEDSKDTHEEDVTSPEEEDSDHEKTETEDEREEAEDEKKPSDKKTSSKKISSDTKDSKKSAEKSSKPTSSPAKKQKVDHDDESSKEKSKKQLIKPQTKGSKEKGKASKKGKAEPTREEMLEVVTKMLKEVDFNTATLSDILQKLSGHFGVDLSHRKKEVKGVITDAISEMSDVEDEEECEVNAEVDSNKEKAEDHEKLED